MSLVHGVWMLTISVIFSCHVLPSIAQGELCPNVTLICHRFASCQFNMTLDSLECVCNENFRGNGTHCSMIDMCAERKHSCDTHANCTPSEGSFACACHAGFTGDGRNCTDIDECTTSPSYCHSNATCTNTLGSFSCSCHRGFAGNGTECQDLDECSSNNFHTCSLSKEWCLNSPGSYTCVCQTGYLNVSGTCTDVDECYPSNTPCHANASCKNTLGSFNCACLEGYKGNGTYCEAMICPQPPTVSNGRHSWGSYPHSSAVQYTCDEGYSLQEHNGLQCIYNTSTGGVNWNRPPPSCIAKSCLNPPSITHGRASPGPYLYKTVVKYTCDYGLSPDDQGLECIYNSSTGDVNWNKPPPACTHPVQLYERNTTISVQGLSNHPSQQIPFIGATLKSLKDYYTGKFSTKYRVSYVSCKYLTAVGNSFSFSCQVQYTQKPDGRQRRRRRIADLDFGALLTDSALHMRLQENLNGIFDIPLGMNISSSTSGPTTSLNSTTYPSVIYTTDIVSTSAIRVITCVPGYNGDHCNELEVKSHLVIDLICAVGVALTVLGLLVYLWRKRTTADDKMESSSIEDTQSGVESHIVFTSFPFLTDTFEVVRKKTFETYEDDDLY